MAFLCLCCGAGEADGVKWTAFFDGFWSLTFVGGVYIFMLGLYLG